MRLWHKDLLSVLPKAQLVAQWRELSAIASAIQKNGTPNHVLVNFVTNYSYDHFISYTYYVREFMQMRGYHTRDFIWEKITALNPNWQLLSFRDIYADKMNFVYYKICFYNLYEKILCGGIKDEDAAAIMNDADKHGIGWRV